PAGQPARVASLQPVPALRRRCAALRALDPHRPPRLLRVLRPSGVRSHAFGPEADHRPRSVTRLRVSVSDAPWAEGAGVGADFLECAGEVFDVGVAEVAGEVLIDSVAVVAARLLHGCPALLGEDDED